MKRFWTHATYAATEADRAAGYGILLDGKPMRLPGGTALRVPTVDLARCIAEEWQAAGGGTGGDILAADTPLTSLAGTAQLRIAPDPAPTIEALARYAASDLLCYRADGPDALVHRQSRAWQPWLDWAALTYDAPLKITSGVVHVTQSRESLRALHAAVAAFDAWRLAGLGLVVPVLGSLVLGLALADGKLDAARAHELGALDELFQAELWGRDADAAKRRDAVAAEVALAARFMSLARAGAAA